MIELSTNTTIAVACLLVTYILTHVFRSNESPKLPGPRQLPFIGRIHDLPLHGTWFKFKEWGDKYGPLYATSMVGAQFIVITDEKIAEDMLVKRAKTYSDRPTMQSVVDSKSQHGSMEYLPLMGKNEFWARQRRYSHAALTQASNVQYSGIIEFEVKRCLFRLIETPDNFSEWLEDMASKITCTLAWDDPTMSGNNTLFASKLLHQISPAGPVTNLLTPLWHLPYWMNPWKQAERVRHDEQIGWWTRQLAAKKEQYESGTLRNCWMRQYLVSAGKSGLSGDFEAACCVGVLAMVGVLTLGGPLHYFLVAMANHPEWLEKCQREMDQVCESKMPTILDSPRLPILRACIKETMRWRPNVPTGVAHECEEDDEYMGYTIRKGSRILPLEYAFLRNPEKYPDPESYRPDRWLDPKWPTYKEPLTEHPNVKGMSSFGWGRRTCLGQTLTQDELVVACGSFCWAFNLKKQMDTESGRPIEVPMDQSTPLLITKPKPFVMAFEPRSGERRKQIVDAWREAEAKDSKAREECLDTS